MPKKAQVHLLKGGKKHGFVSKIQLTGQLPLAKPPVGKGVVGKIKGDLPWWTPELSSVDGNNMGGPKKVKKPKKTFVTGLASRAKNPKSGVPGGGLIVKKTFVGTRTKRAPVKGQPRKKKNTTIHLSLEAVRKIQNFELLHSVLGPDRFEVWLNAPNEFLDHKSPAEVVFEGGSQIVSELIHDMLAGNPT